MLRLALASILTCVALATASPADETLIGEDGLHKQSWFLNSSGDLRRDLSNASADGKILMLVIEQIGCAYCAEMHARNFQRPEILEVIESNFTVLQLDLNGSDVVVDLDGESAKESALMRKWGVFTTPTTIVLRNDATAGAPLKEAEAFRLPGYLKPFEHFAVLDYFASGAFEAEDLRPFMLAKFDELVSGGLNPASW